MYPTIENRNSKYIKAVRIDELTDQPNFEGANVTIDGGIVNYVKRQMHCETVTRDVMRQAIAFEREMSKMQGW
jgi:hypothetical protein